MSAQSAAAPLFTPAVTATTDAPPLPVRQPEGTSPPADSPPAESEDSDAKLPKWIICITTDHEHGTDPNANPPEIIRLCRKCGTSCWVKPEFIERGCWVICWGCFRAHGGRTVMIHPEMEQEYLAAGFGTLAWEGIDTMRKWLAEADSYVGPLTSQWWANRRRGRAK
jgi:hypothetical protein